MKLIFAIVSDDDSPRLMAEVNRAGYRVTKLHSTGGFAFREYDTHGRGGGYGTGRCFQSSGKFEKSQGGD